jgi:hypothetical protein
MRPVNFLLLLLTIGLVDIDQNQCAKRLHRQTRVK